MESLIPTNSLALGQNNPSPGFATSIFVSWDDIADYFDLFDTYPLCKEDSETPEVIINLAFTKARKWARQYAKSSSYPLRDQQIVTAENKILESLKDHWSSSSALSGQFDFHLYVKQTNDWSLSGAKDSRIFIPIPDPGKSIDYFLNSLGVCFTIYPPFTIPYTEVYYALYDSLPEWDYDEINGVDIIETLFSIYEINDGEIDIDIERLADTWSIDYTNML